jgi:hypothetical protein
MNKHTQNLMQRISKIFDKHFTKIPWSLKFFLFSIIILIPVLLCVIYYAIVNQKIEDFFEKLIIDLTNFWLITLVISYLYYRFETKKLNPIRRPKMKEYVPYIHSQFDISGISLNDFNIQQDAVEELIRNGINNNVRYRFLLCNPKSQHLLQRAEEEGEKIVGTGDSASFTLKRKCKNTIKNLMEIKKSIEKGNSESIVQIRIHDKIPRRSVIITDEKLFVGPYFYQKKGTETAWADIPNIPLRYEYIDEFNILFNEAINAEEKDAEDIV